MLYNLGARLKHNAILTVISESCGSCYSFASMAMNEARIRIMTNNTQTPVFSPQDIVECSEYSQGNADRTL